jgi:hypothetical protein
MVATFPNLVAQPKAVSGSTAAPQQSHRNNMTMRAQISSRTTAKMDETCMGVADIYRS